MSNHMSYLQLTYYPTFLFYSEDDSMYVSRLSIDLQIPHPMMIHSQHILQRQYTTGI